MFKMEVDNRIASKGTTVIDYTFDKVLEFFSDSSVTQKINESMVKFEILEDNKEAGYRIVYMEHKGMWPVAGRDFVIVSIRKQDGDTFYIATRSCSYPKPDVDKLVRAELFVGGYII